MGAPTIAAMKSAAFTSIVSSPDRTFSLCGR
jgi:hypothetical protein